jgi:aminoglycoside phosphotransferase (APT) family kinase protein
MVRQLIREQCPGVDGTALVRLGEGWDSETYLADGWVLRFPKRRALVRQLEREADVLRLIADRLPIAVPRFELSGRPGAAFPYPFVGYRKLPGVTLSEMLGAPMTPREEEETAAAFGAFLTALHRVPIEELPADLPREPAEEAAEFREFDEVFPGLATVHPVMAERVAAFRRAHRPRAWTGRAVLIHDDLLPEHVLMADRPTRLSGIIDWGDVKIGPPVRDVVGAYVWRGRAFTRRVLAHYDGDVNDADLDWMRVRALSIGLSNVEYGRLAALPEYVRSGLHAIEQALAG